MSRVYLDLETLPALHWTPEERRAYAAEHVPKSYKKPDSIAGWLDDNTEEQWKRTALDPLRGLVCCCCVAVDDGPVESWVSLDPGTQVIDLLDWVHARFGPRDALCGQNVTAFDLRWLYLRATRHRHPLTHSLPWTRPNVARWRTQERIIDLLDLWKGPAWQRPPSSMDEIRFGLGLASDNPCSGSQVYDLWCAGDIETIEAHCRADVEDTRAAVRLLLGEEAA